MAAITPVILSGGSGTRLWPLSRKNVPKQLIALPGHARTLLQQTLDRLNGLDNSTHPVVVCNEAHRFLVAEQTRESTWGLPQIILEPVARNTAPGVATAALRLLQTAEDTLMLVMPSDHRITAIPAFHKAVTVGAEAAQSGALVTFGIVPTHAETGYGYIRASSTLDAHHPCAAVSHFVEKPDRATAEAYLASGHYLWNSGIFLFQAKRYIEELQEHAPAILDACRKALDGASTDLDFLRLNVDAFTACPSESIDVAVMEKTKQAMVVGLDAGWSDLGCWSALHATSAQDNNGNVTTGDVLMRGSKRCYIHSDNRLVAALGLQDCIIVDTPDAVLIAARNQTQEVKKLVDQLRQQNRTEALEHRRVERPWGSYESIARGDRFQVKRMIVAPGRSLSLQMHHHRAEHWVVVRGTGKVTRGDESYLISEDESTYIPLGTRHRLENPGVLPLELIEVQTGAYLGEDDIVRFDWNP